MVSDSGGCLLYVVFFPLLLIEQEKEGSLCGNSHLLNVVEIVTCEASPDVETQP